MNDKNYGYDHAEELASHSEDDWHFGGGSPSPLFVIPKNLRLVSLPLGEVQRGKDDMMDCTTRGPINKLEADFTYAVTRKLFSESNIKWLKDKGYWNAQRKAIEFSDAFNAILSETKKTGNSMKAPINSIHSGASGHGLIPKMLLPLNKNMTWEIYHDRTRITQSMLDLGKAFSKRFNIKYERVSAAHMKELNEQEMLVVAGHAWNRPKNGVYERTLDKINHVFLNVTPEYIAFDNYIDTDGNDFLKTLAPDFLFMGDAYRIFIAGENPDVVDSWWSVETLTRIIESLKKLIGIMEESPREVEKVEPAPIVPEHPPEMTRAQVLYAYAEKLVSQRIDVSPRDVADDDVGCVESMCEVIRGSIFPDFKRMVSTIELKKELDRDKRFKQTLDLTPGNVMVTMTGTGNGKVRGHTWVIGQNHLLMSNDSRDGIWKQNYTVDQVVKRWRTYGGMQIFVYEPQ